MVAGCWLVCRRRVRCWLRLVDCGCYLILVVLGGTGDLVGFAFIVVVVVCLCCVFACFRLVVLWGWTVLLLFC